MTLICLPTQDSEERASLCQTLLSRNRFDLVKISQDTLKILNQQSYQHEGQEIDLSEQLQRNLEEKHSITPEAQLTLPDCPKFERTQVLVSNETTLMAARRFAERGQRTLVLNFANGTQVGGGFLLGARAQEETLCYASSLYQTLKGDPFYHYHRFKRIVASDYAIVSKVIVFRDDQYHLLGMPWQMDVITAAAPIAINIFGVSQKRGARLMDARITRVYEIAAALGYHNLVLGAWGCGAFANDPVAISKLFREHLEVRFTGWFSEVVFAIADWSAKRKFLAPFAQTFCA